MSTTSATTPARQAEHLQRFHQVLRHIDAQLDQPLQLAELAAIAHFSPYHFHRLFAAWNGGETLGEYVSRRRVELGAHRLLMQHRQSVTAVALAVGFASGEAFARAFKLRYGQSPTAWRAAHCNDSNLDQALGNLCQDSGPAAANNAGMNPAPAFDIDTVRLLDRPATPVAYLRYQGPLGQPVQRFWQTRAMPLLRRLGPAAHFGISHDEPLVSDAQRCRYDAAAELAEGQVLPKGLLRTVLPAGRYAALRFFGSSEQIGAAWAALLRDWLPDSGWQLDYRPCFEHYPLDAGSDAPTQRFECEICIPVAAA